MLDNDQLLNYFHLDSVQRLAIERATAVSEDDMDKLNIVFDDNDSTFYELPKTKSTKPWIQLELSDKGPVKQVHIFNRLDGCGVTISNAEVRVSTIERTTNNADEWPKSDLCGKYEREKKKGEEMEAGKEPSKTKCRAQHKGVKKGDIEKKHDEKTSVKRKRSLVKKPSMDSLMATDETAIKDETKGKEVKENAKNDETITDEVIVINCSTPLTGKYVTITVTNDQGNKFHIAEVEVYGQITGRQ